MEKKLYFAYGSNLSKAQMEYRCTDSTPVCPFTLHEWRLCFNKHANIRPDTNSKVTGALYWISPQDEEILDSYERNYEKFTFTTVLDSTSCTVVSYTQKTDSIHPTDAAYYHRIATGYDDWNLDISALETAVIQSNDCVPAVCPARPFLPVDEMFDNKNAT